MRIISVFVIGDLHLSFGLDKPMDIFGPKWRDHAGKIKQNWSETVKASDTVIIPGDFSWAMNVAEALPDFLFLENLPGRKIISKGNHDYWWQTAKKLGDFLNANSLKTISFLQNNAFTAENFIICGTRGWLLEENYDLQDKKIVDREVQRLKLSLEQGILLKEKSPQNEIIVFLHYPPAYGTEENAGICALLTDYGINRCYYGHLHNENGRKLISRLAVTALTLVSADYIGFAPVLIPPEGS